MKKGQPAIVCIIGGKNAGKTELTVGLGAELNRRGYRVMTVKHAHGFDLDQPGRDSWRHRHQGGAFRTVLASPSSLGVVGAWPEEEMALSELVERFLSDGDIVLAEGFKSAPEPKIEVFRAGPGKIPLCEQDPETASRTVAMVTDRPGLSPGIPVWDPGTEGYLVQLADFIEERFMAGKNRP